MATVAERADFSFTAGDLDAEVLRVLRFRGTEGVSQLGRFQIDLTSTDPDVDFDALVGEKCCLTWKGVEETRWVHGIVSQFEITGHGRHMTYYSARLVPKMWLLTRRSQSRIFQNQTTPDILKKVFEEGGLPSDEFKISLKRSYKARKYCVQYRETDMDFASRLMEEEGIFYFFEHTDEGHKLYVADDASIHEPITGEATLPFKPGDEGRSAGEAILGFRYGRSVRTGLVTLREFDFKKPSLDLTTDDSADKWKELEEYDYPGEYPDKALGKDLVKIRLEEHQARREAGVGEGICRMMAPGHNFTLEGHGRDALNQDYLITMVQHWGSQPQAADVETAGGGHAQEPTYHNGFECMPTTRPYRPERVTPTPLIEGPQTAIVTGPKGEEIHTDEYGRVKVRFFWDRSGVTDDKSSCWIRVSQGWGGAGWGGIYIPRVGHEVIVEFLEGDPDRPLITGRVYNGENPPPYGLPGAKTQSTIKSNSSPGGGGSNELRFEDAAGSEEVFFHAQKDMNEVVLNNRTREVGNDETVHVANNRAKTVDVDQSEKIGANKKIEVGSNHDETIGSNMTLKVGSNCDETIGSNHTITIGSALTETVAAAAAQVVGGGKNTTVGGGFSIMVGGATDLKVGGSDSETIAGDQSSQVGGKQDNKIGGARGTKVGGDDTAEVGGKQGVTVKGDWSLSTDAKGILKAKADLGVESDANVAVKGKKIAVGGSDQISLECGSASITLKKSGDILINGKKVEVKGSGDVILKGSNVKAN